MRNVDGRREGQIFILSAPSGAGKTTLVNRLLRCVRGVVRSVSMTTRPPRPGERRGRDYHFVTRARFAATRRQGGLLESATVHGAWYGTPVAPVKRTLRAGRDVLLSIDVQGATQVVRRLPCVRIFILPPSMNSLRRRLEHRRTESPAQIRARLALARRELQAVPQYDYVVVNDELRQAVAQLHAILTAERCRVRSQTALRRWSRACCSSTSACAS